MTELKPFLNQHLQLIALPAKNRKRLHALYYLAEKLETGRSYTEKDINGLLEKWHTFHDPATLRREMYNHCLLKRSRDGSTYWLDVLPDMEEWIVRYI